MKVRLAFVGLMVGLCWKSAAVWGDNPIVNTRYGADPSARVWGGQMWVYASHDRNDAQEYDMNDYHVYSSDDLKNWTDHGAIIDLKSIPWAKSHLWAPDCIEKNGTYYLYFPASISTKYDFRIGVATSKSPSGPFVAQTQPFAGVSGIDPGVFIDDDGKAYLYWAAGGVMAARLKPNMIELDGVPQKVEGIEKFFEGPSMFKRQGKYYLTYPAKQEGGSGDGGSGQNYDYAIGNSPLGPFEYKGTWTQSASGGNIHGSQVEWDRHWYCVYHDYSTSFGRQKSGFKRALRVDELEFNPDGTIKPLVWTSAGPPKLKNLNPFERVEAETIGGSDVPEGEHAVSTEPCSEGGQHVSQIENGDWIKYANVDLGEGATHFEARLAAPHEGAKMELRLDSLSGQLIGICAVPNTGDWQKWRTASCDLKGAKGVRDLYVRFTGDGQGGLANFDWFQFKK